jgi:hypothetical protein
MTPRHKTPPCALRAWDHLRLLLPLTVAVAAAALLIVGA